VHEQLLEMKKKQLDQQIDKKGRIGLSLHRLKEVRRDIDKFLGQTENFNNRLLNPVAWMKTIKTK